MSNDKKEPATITRWYDSPIQAKARKLDNDLCEYDSQYSRETLIANVPFLKELVEEYEQKLNDMGAEIRGLME